MIIVYLEKLNEFSKNHANARVGIEGFRLKAQGASWWTKQDVLATFPRAKMLADNRARFEIAHNTYRIIIKIVYEAQIVQVRFIGTHNDYDRIDPITI